MDPLLPEQDKQLKTWAEQRDSILLEISSLKTEREGLEKRNKDLSDSNTEIQGTIVKSIGRMEELDKQEDLYTQIVSDEIPKLESEKTKLETLIAAFQKEVDTLKSEKNTLIKDIEFLRTTHNEVFDRTGILREIVENVTKISSTNIQVMDSTISALKLKVEEILQASTDGIDANNRILNEIPRLFVELQRKSLIREKIK